MVLDLDTPPIGFISDRYKDLKLGARVDSELWASSNEALWADMAGGVAPYALESEAATSFDLVEWVDS